MGETVRFSEVVETAGSPDVYLPLSDPQQDRNFMRGGGDRKNSGN
jgi:hypothetical protein